VERPDRLGGDPHLSPFHLASYAVLIGGFWLIAAAWSVLHAAAQKEALSTTGPYASLRHPQYLGFLLTMVGVPPAVAEHPDAGDVPGPRLRVRAACAQ
jgi:protein-S-isoprenylcysteine O-methyltransferase Ste14